MRLLGVARMAPWWRGPWLLLRRPGVVLALIAASFVATLPAAAAAPFLSSATNATLASQITNTCQWSVGSPTPGGPNFPTDAFGTVTQPAAAKADTDYISHARASAARIDTAHDLTAPIVSMTLQEEVTAHGAPPRVVNLMARDGFRDHVTPLQGPTGPGAWIPDTMAADLHLKVGDTFDVQVVVAQVGLEFVEGEHKKVRVAAIYRDLRSQPDEAWWCDAVTLYRGSPEGDAPVFPLVLMDQATLLPVAEDDALGIALHMAVRDPNADVDDVPRVTDSIAKISDAIAGPPDPTAKAGPTPKPVLASFVARTRLARVGLRPGVVPITIAGVLVGMLVVAAAGVFWVLRRRRELTLLSAHGVGARSIGVKAAIECTPALFFGTALAWAAAWELVRRAGPSPTVSPEAATQSLWAALASLAGAILVVAIAASLRSRSLADEAHRRHSVHLSRLPWELLLLGAAYYAWRQLGAATLATGKAGGDAGAVVHVPARLLVVPILIIAGVVAFGFRLLGLVLRSRASGRGLNRGERNGGERNGGERNRGERNGGTGEGGRHAAGSRTAGNGAAGRTPRARRGTAKFLGGRRLVREAAIVAILGGATAMPIALATYGATVTDSVKATVVGEAYLSVGDDVVATLSKPAPIPASLAGQATTVLRVNQVDVGDITVDILAVDPVQFEKVAYWNSSIDGTSLAGLLAPLLAPHVAGTPWPAVATGKVRAGIVSPQWALATTPVFDIRKVDILPAPHSGYGVLIVDRDAIGPTEQAVHSQVWIRGNAQDIQPKLKALPVEDVRTVAQNDAHTVLEPLTYTFEYLSALSLLTGVVTAVGLLLYLEARAPGHRRGYVMLRRMGLPNRTHRLALLIELATPLLTGLVVGFALAVGLVRWLAPNFDVDVTVPPGTLLTYPDPAIVGICAAVVIMTLLATVFAQLRISRANPSEVLRDSL